MFTQADENISSKTSLFFTPTAHIFLCSKKMSNYISKEINSNFAEKFV